MVCAARFDRGFHSPANRTRLDELLVDSVLPRKGRLSKADRDREQGETFVAMRRQHSAVVSAVNNLEHRGLDRVRSIERDLPERLLWPCCPDVHRLGLMFQQVERHCLAPEEAKQTFATRQLREPKGIPNDLKPSRNR